MSAFGQGFGAGGYASAAGGGFGGFGGPPFVRRGNQLSRSISTGSTGSNVSELTEGSQPGGRGELAPIDETLYDIDENYDIIGGDADFARQVNNALDEAIEKTLNEEDEESIATEMLTGQYDANITFASILGTGLYQTIKTKYDETIQSIALNVSDEASVASAASAESALTAISKLRSDAVLQFKIQLVLSKKMLERKFAITYEIIDYTFAEFYFACESIDELLTRNNRFGILKGACANSIPIWHDGEQKTLKIYYFLKELKWMLEQAEGAKSGTRLTRYFSISYCLNNPFAICLFDIIYYKMCKSVGNMVICAIGGNVLRAFFLVLRHARDGTPCDAIDELISGHRPCPPMTPENIAAFRQFAGTIPNLDMLCDKPSDADFTNYVLVPPHFHKVIEDGLKVLCGDKNDTGTLTECKGPITLQLTRAKGRIPANVNSFAKCFAIGGTIDDYQQTIKMAHSYYPKVKWFSQMTDPSADLDKMFPFPKTGIVNGKPITENQNLQIKAVYCILQTIKTFSTTLTSKVGEIISNVDPGVSEYQNLMIFIDTCLTILIDQIGILPIGSDVSLRIETIVQHVVPAANKALILILQDEYIRKVIKKVITDVCDERYLNLIGIDVFKKEDNTPMWYPTTSIAVGNPVSGSNERVSQTLKAASLYQRNAIKSGAFEPELMEGMCMSFNILQFSEPISIEDATNSEQTTEQLASSAEEPAAEPVNIFEKLSSQPKNKLKDVKPKPLKEITDARLKQIIKDYNADKKPIDKIKGYNKFSRNELIQTIMQNGIQFKGGAKTRKRKPRKTRKRGKRGMRKTRKGAIK